MALIVKVVKMQWIWKISRTIEPIHTWDKCRQESELPKASQLRNPQYSSP